MKNKIETIELQSPIGRISAGASEKGICFVHFIDEHDSLWRENLAKKFNAELILSESNIILTQLKTELEEYFNGSRQVFSVQLDLQGTTFQVKVWNELLNILYGETRTYLQQAKAFGDVRAIRAIATTNGKNNIAIIIPCHRIIGSNGSLTGYAGGLEKKKWLIELEQKNSGKSYQQSLF